jgi:NAD(P)-dependent dehydrogenase (short-subunit alcohol dehydrogenase family)
MSEKKTIVITGASDGIGAAAARQLHRDEHTVVIVGRSEAKTTAIAQELGVDYFLADFTRLDDVRRLASDLRRSYARIDVLANNAGGVFGTQTSTADGFEKTFQVNHLAPFLLTRLLLDRLIASGASVLQTSSSVRFAGKIDLDDLDHNRKFDAANAYAVAKLENILFTGELHRRYHAEGLSAASFYPGNVATNFGSETTDPVIRFVRILASNPIGRRLLLSTPEQGAAQIVRLAEGTAGSDWQPGAYYYRGRAVKPANKQALDADLARGLWERSEQLLGDRLKAA